MGPGIKTWHDLLHLPWGTELTLEDAGARQLDNRLIALPLENAYLVGNIWRRYGKVLTQEPQMVLWAIGDDVARVVAAPSFSEAPAVDRFILPPEELNPFKPVTFGGIMRGLAAQHNEGFESAVYSANGRFLFRTVSTGGTQYYFLENQTRSGEPVAAITRRIQAVQ